MTTKITNGLWRFAVRQVPAGRRRHGVLSQVGTPILALIIALWALLMWAG